MNYVAPWWLPGGQLQTIWPAVHARRQRAALGATPLPYQRERWPTPDGDFIDLDWLYAPQAGTLLVMFHGLEGSSQSHYARAFADHARQQGLSFVVPHFRGCSGEINLAPRAYHSGDYLEIDWILQSLRQRHSGAILVVGVSLGGNALLRWAEEAGSQACHTVDAVASISAPVDLAASGQAIGRGLNRLVYTRMFLASMKPKARLKLAQHPGLFSAQALHGARDLYAFDNVFTAPLHGFKNTDDYWARASAKPHLASIRVPTLVVNALNDPFVPAHSLPHASHVGQNVTLWQPRHGGHVGFAQGRPPGHLRTLPERVVGWLQTQGPSHG
ncbi:YheT family hydrolase [Rhodoferax antarcticus]|uniref:Putative alpha/beta hydrolase fold protein n=1 Tax=Rhodoferax antarcticus ANT.BR TaxID=1111071 RepID=A0A1Q8YFR6_9BURK|nr:alpha/beta fold hydrolase [Rhodoferax antarcticus]APW45407.1 alpha/beta hydrolase [Rhodoferax antarcticus]OLP06832.1 putative alpha/beta hydrolase fold protein [Rhodoferax antarcticus ANT.BR]